MRTWCVALLVVASCSKSDPRPAAGSAGSAGSAAAPPPAVAGLAIYVDDHRIETVSIEQLSAWTRLDTLVPIDARRLGKWELVTLVGDKTTELKAPSATYPELVPAVFASESKTPAFGMFDPVELAKHGKPALAADHLREVRIKLAKDSGRGEHEQGSGGGADPTQLKVTVKTPKGTQVIDGPKLLAIPRDNIPGNGDGKGWPVKTLLDLAGVKTFDRMVLTDQNGTALNLARSDFDPKTSIPFVKLNRSGLLRLRVYQKHGDTWTPGGGDLRGLVAIEILK